MALKSDDPRCICAYGMRSLGRVDHISMGTGKVRLSTTKDCPVHNACQGYTAEFRASRTNGEWLYCPIHRTKNCPD